MKRAASTSDPVGFVCVCVCVYFWKRKYFFCVCVCFWKRKYFFLEGKVFCVCVCILLEEKVFFVYTFGRESFFFVCVYTFEDHEQLSPKICTHTKNGLHEKKISIHETKTSCILLKTMSNFNVRCVLCIYIYTHISEITKLMSLSLSYTYTYTYTHIRPGQKYEP